MYLFIQINKKNLEAYYYRRKEDEEDFDEP